MRTLRSILIPVAAGFSLLAALGLAASVLFLYREAATIHPVLGYGVLALAGVAVVLLIVYPVVRVLRLPKPLRRPDATTGRGWNRFLERYAGRLLKNPAVMEYPRRDELKTALAGPTVDTVSIALQTETESAVSFLDDRTRTLICRHAAAVFAATAISQSGRLDTAIVVSAQLRLVREIAELYYQRPHPREMWDLYLNVGSSAFVAGEIQDSEMLAVLSAPISAGLSGLIPVTGTGPLIGMLTTSLLDGSANALLTLRVGVLARRYCGIGIIEDRRAVSRSASLEAAGLLSGVVSEGARRVGEATRKSLVSGAFNSTQSAARGVADVGTQVVGGIGRMLGKAGTAAFDATRAVTREAWRQVAERPEPVDTATDRSSSPLESVVPESARPTEGPGTDAPNSSVSDALRFWSSVQAVFGGDVKQDPESLH